MRSCVRKLNVRNFSSQYIKYACYYGKVSPVRKYFDTNIFNGQKFPELRYIKCSTLNNYLFHFGTESRVGESLPTACRVGWTADRQLVLAFRGIDEVMGCVPWSGPDLEGGGGGRGRGERGEKGRVGEEGRSMKVTAVRWLPSHLIVNLVVSIFFIFLH